MPKITLEGIKEELAQVSWNLISDNYETIDSEMIFECPEGHRVFTTWKKIRNKYECPTCKINNLANLNNEIVPKPKGARRVLALDQATHTTGWAIFDDLQLVKYGSFSTELDDEVARFALIRCWLLSMIQSWRPDFIGLEGIQYQDQVSGGPKMGITVFQTLARLQGVLMEACFESKIQFEVCATNTWRHACGVKGVQRTDRKRSMQLLVKEWYDITVTDDESDAIGIGHYLTTRLNKINTIENWET